LKEKLWGSLDSWKAHTTFVVKTHALPAVKPFDKAVLVVRNPMEAAVADFQRLATGNSNVGRVDPAFLVNNPLFRGFFESRLWKTACWLSAWLRTGKGKC